MLNIIEVKHYDVINGPGIRTSIWTAGCSNHCKGCWSPHTWNPNQGSPLGFILPTIESYLKDQKTDGVSILGGDPFFCLMNNDEEGALQLITLLRLIKTYNKNIWVWTGYLFDDLVIKAQQFLGDSNWLTDYIDILVEGPFIESQKNLNLLFRGSENQRLLDMSKFRLTH